MDTKRDTATLPQGRVRDTEKLLGVYRIVYERGLGDVTVKLGDGTTRRAISAVLESWSPVFATMFAPKATWQESESRSVDLEHHPANLVDGLLRYLHCLEEPDMAEYTVQERWELINICEVYEIGDLQKMVVDRTVTCLGEYGVRDQCELVTLCHAVPAVETRLVDRILEIISDSHATCKSDDLIIEYLDAFQGTETWDRIYHQYLDRLVKRFSVGIRSSPHDCYDRHHRAHRFTPHATCCLHWKDRGPDINRPTGDLRGPAGKGEYLCIAWLMDGMESDTILQSHPECVTDYCCYHRKQQKGSMKESEPDPESVRLFKEFQSLDPEVREDVTRMLFGLRPL